MKEMDGLSDGDLEALVAGVEMGLDWNLEIQEEDMEIYREYIKNKEEEKMKSQHNENNQAAEPEDILAKLSAYESTGITPEQIREIDKLYSEQAKELHELKTLISGNNLPDDVKKAILVLDMPETCEDCPLQLDMIDAEFGEIIYNANICRGCGKRNINSKEKPVWCPLKQVSEA